MTEQPNPIRRIHPDKAVDEGMVENLCNFFAYRALSEIEDPSPEWEIWKGAISRVAEMLDTFQSPDKVMQMIAVLIATTDFQALMEDFYEEMRKEARNN
jgi:hypothetical protein